MMPPGAMFGPGRPFPPGPGVGMPMRGMPPGMYGFPPHGMEMAIAAEQQQMIMRMMLVRVSAPSP